MGHAPQQLKADGSGGSWLGLRKPKLIEEIASVSYKRREHIVWSVACAAPADAYIPGKRFGQKFWLAKRCTADVQLFEVVAAKTSFENIVAPAGNAGRSQHDLAGHRLNGACMRRSEAAVIDVAQIWYKPQSQKGAQTVG